MRRYLKLWNTTNALRIATVSSIATWTTYLQEDEVHCSSKKVFSWGSSGYGQLGHGVEIDETKPKPLEVFKNNEPFFIAAGGENSAVISKSGLIYTFGAGGNCRLGQGESFDSPNQSTPQALPPFSHNQKAKKVAIGEYHMAALTEASTLWTWGKKGCPQLGHQSPNGGFPSEVVSLSGHVRDVDCGRQHTVAITHDGKVYSWGINYEGALGHGDRQNRSEPQVIESLLNREIVQVSCGREFTLALDKEGKVYSWGANDYGQLGIGGSVRYQRSPKEISFLSEKKIVQVEAGEFHSCALTSNGSVYIWGMGKDGQLGQGATEDANLPMLVHELEGKKITSVSCGGGHTACISSDGTLWMFGRGRNGQLGRGDQLESIAAYRTTPCPVQSVTNVSQVSCGSDHTLALGTS